MIAPSNYYAGITLDEAVEGFLEDGETSEDAQMLAHILVAQGDREPLM